VGAFFADLLVDRLSGKGLGDPLMQTAFAAALAIIALGASVLHLGRPWQAWRGFLGFRTSWLSREAVAFALFALLAASYGTVTAAPMLGLASGTTAIARAAAILRNSAAAAGVLGVFCSVMVYVATKREQWSSAQTGMKFFGSTALLGTAMFLAVGICTSHRLEPIDHVSRSLFFLVFLVTSVKVLYEARVLLHVRDARQSTEKRMATVMLGDLLMATKLRFGFALAGGVLVPFFLWAQGFGRNMAVPATVIMLVLLALGEIGERYLFFSAAPASRMPGSIR
jgi:DMSO reductase anchor subunit